VKSGNFSGFAESKEIYLLRLSEDLAEDDVPVLTTPGFHSPQLSYLLAKTAAG
jgi:hypothetical protein